MEYLPKILLISLFSGVITQLIKISIKTYKTKNFSIRYMDDYGGMPSSHAAFLASLLTAVYLKDGLVSTSFAVTFVIAAILIRDAIGIRMELEKHGKLIKKMVNVQNLHEEMQIDGKLGDRMGHTWPEIVVGGAIGILIAALIYNAF